MAQPLQYYIVKDVFNYKFYLKMKKVILFAALLIGCLAFANAGIVNSEAVSTVKVTNGDYNEVALKDLNEIVQEAVISFAGETYHIAKVEFDAENELTKVSFLNKEDDTLTIVIFDKEGKEVKE